MYIEQEVVKNKKDFIKYLKNMIKEDWNYKKGVSFVPEIVNTLLNHFEELTLEEIMDETRIEVAKTGSIYITCYDFQARISDHSQSENNRNFSKMVTGRVAGNLRVTYSK